LERRRLNHRRAGGDIYFHYVADGSGARVLPGALAVRETDLHWQ
jgi:hypothetical protein